MLKLLPRHWTPVSEALGGGQADVYRVQRDGDSADYALKILRDPSREARFKRETATMTALSADLPHAVPAIIETGRSGRRNLPYYVIPWFEKGNLADMIKCESPSSPTRLEILIDLAMTLRQVHGFGVAHRDLKPQNVLMTDSGTPVLADFGLCLIVPQDDEDNERLTETGRAVGSRLYVAPENEAGFNERENQLACDFYSFAKVVWVVMTGRGPCSGEDQLRTENLLANLSADFYRLDQLGAQLLDRDPEQRLQDWSIVVNEMSALLGGPVGISGPMVESIDSQTAAAVAAARRLRLGPVGMRFEAAQRVAAQDRSELAELGAVVSRTVAAHAAPLKELTAQLRDFGQVQNAVGGPSLDEVAMYGVFDDLLEQNEGMVDRSALVGSERAVALVMASFQNGVDVAAIGIWLLQIERDIYAVRIPYLAGPSDGAYAVLIPPQDRQRCGKVYGPYRLGVATSRESMVSVGIELVHVGVRLSVDSIAIVERGEQLHEPSSWATG